MRSLCVLEASLNHTDHNDKYMVTEHRYHCYFGWYEVYLHHSWNRESINHSDKTIEYWSSVHMMNIVRKWYMLICILYIKIIMTGLFPRIMAVFHNLIFAAQKFVLILISMKISVYMVIRYQRIAFISKLKTWNNLCVVYTNVHRELWMNTILVIELKSFGIS